VASKLANFGGKRAAPFQKGGDRKAAGKKAAKTKAMRKAKGKGY
jgi:hypothetical protein